jgi:hypothetical protein
MQLFPAPLKKKFLNKKYNFSLVYGRKWEALRHSLLSLVRYVCVVCVCVRVCVCVLARARARVCFYLYVGRAFPPSDERR